MAKWGNCKFDQLKEYAERLEKLTDADIEELCIKCSKELAARLLALVIPRTPVGDYSILKVRTARKDTKYHKKGEQYTVHVKPKSGKMGGTLRRGWTSKTHDEAASGTGKRGKPAKEYAASLPVRKVGDYYKIQIINPVEYASYVEFGHRTKSGGWVEGQYMLTISEEQLKQISPAVLQRMINKKLHEVLNG
jgi:hypothetical protein|nr:MAG TPA: type I neck protein [Caudoviricetes sp.]